MNPQWLRRADVGWWGFQWVLLRRGGHLAGWEQPRKGISIGILSYIEGGVSDDGK